MFHWHLGKPVSGLPTFVRNSALVKVSIGVVAEEECWTSQIVVPRSPFCWLLLPNIVGCWYLLMGDGYLPTSMSIDCYWLLPLEITLWLLKAMVDCVCWPALAKSLYPLSLSLFSIAGYSCRQTPASATLLTFDGSHWWWLVVVDVGDRIPITLLMLIFVGHYCWFDLYYF